MMKLLDQLALYVTVSAVLSKWVDVQGAGATGERLMLCRLGF